MSAAAWPRPCAGCRPSARPDTAYARRRGSSRRKNSPKIPPILRWTIVTASASRGARRAPARRFGFGRGRARRFWRRFSAGCFARRTRFTRPARFARFAARPRFFGGSRGGARCGGSFGRTFGSCRCFARGFPFARFTGARGCGFGGVRFACAAAGRRSQATQPPWRRRRGHRPRGSAAPRRGRKPCRAWPRPSPRACLPPVRSFRC